MTPFIPQGPSAVINWSDDSTDTSITLNTAQYGMPNCLLVVNPDANDEVAFSYSFDPDDTNASLPNSGANGIGTIIGRNSTVLLRVDSAYRTGNLYLSAAGLRCGVPSRQCVAVCPAKCCAQAHGPGQSALRPRPLRRRHR